VDSDERGDGARMSIVTLASGGLDSSLMMHLIREEGIAQYPLFVNYGQRSLDREIKACQHIVRSLRLPSPTIVDISNWGRTVGSGLTTRRLRIFEDAFLPGRNMMFLLIASSIAYRRGASSVAIGLLSDDTTIFPDQTRAFCKKAAGLLGQALGRSVTVVTPLKGFSKAQVVGAARNAGIAGTYSCHAGTKTPCGKCVACREYEGIEV
jgi:7-cyano-7-deazaguanine synthase